MLLVCVRLFAFCPSTGYFLFASVYVPNCITSKTMQLFYRCAKILKISGIMWAGCVGDVNDLTICACAVAGSGGTFQLLRDDVTYRICFRIRVPPSSTSRLNLERKA